MYIILDQSQACYDAPDMFNGYCETIADLKNYFKFYCRKENYQITVLNTCESLNDGGHNCKEYSYKEIIDIIDKTTWHKQHSKLSLPRWNKQGN